MKTIKKIDQAFPLYAMTLVGMMNLCLALENFFDNITSVHVKADFHVDPHDQGDQVTLHATITRLHKPSKQDATHKLMQTFKVAAWSEVFNDPEGEPHKKMLFNICIPLVEQLAKKEKDFAYCLQCLSHEVQVHARVMPGEFSTWSRDCLKCGTVSSNDPGYPRRLFHI